MVICKVSITSCQILKQHSFLLQNKALYMNVINGFYIFFPAGKRFYFQHRELGNFVSWDPVLMPSEVNGQTCQERLKWHWIKPLASCKTPILFTLHSKYWQFLGCAAEYVFNKRQKPKHTQYLLMCSLPCMVDSGLHPEQHPWCHRHSSAIQFGGHHCTVQDLQNHKLIHQTTKGFISNIYIPYVLGHQYLTN